MMSTTQRGEGMKKELEELLQMIRGEGNWFITGPGLSTYPKGDENNKKIFAACLELEEEGLFWRRTDEPDYVFWLPKGG